MRKRTTTRRAVTIEIERLGAALKNAGLGIANPLRGQPLAVPLPDEVQLGDTPEGEPAILWRLPPMLPEVGAPLDWGAGGTPQAAFWAFLDLAQETQPEPFVWFVRRFGPLGLWPYRTRDGKKIFGLDYWVPSVPEGILTPHRYAAFRDEQEYDAVTQAGFHGMLYEPIVEWRQWAQWFQAVIEISIALRAGELGQRRWWAALGHENRFDPRRTWGSPGFTTDVRVQRQEISQVIQRRFLRWSGLTPIFLWESERPELGLALGGAEAVRVRRHSTQFDWPENVLFPALVAELIAIISVSEPSAICSRCGRRHRRNRKARTDQPVYCDSCRVAARRATKSESNVRARARNRAQAM